MNRIAVAKEIVKLARELVAEDVSSFVKQVVSAINKLEHHPNLFTVVTQGKKFIVTYSGDYAPADILEIYEHNGNVVVTDIYSSYKTLKNPTIKEVVELAGAVADDVSLEA
jgi:predicted RNA-binding protein